MYSLLLIGAQLTSAFVLGKLLFDEAKKGNAELVVRLALIILVLLLSIQTA
jgi:hypothetical protein